MAAGYAQTAVVPLGEDDVAFAAALHAEALPDGFFVELGPAFLRAYYRAFKDSPHAVALVAAGPDGPRGVVVGTVDDRAHYRWILRHRFREHASSALRGLLAHPSVALRFARTRAMRYGRGVIRLRARRRSSAARSGPAPSTAGVLSHLAVAASHRDNGVGRELVNAFVDRAHRSGARRLRVQTRARGGAAPFYEHLGWRPAGIVRNLDGIDFRVLTLER